jgi:short-chain fatty acids transporter
LGTAPANRLERFSHALGNLVPDATSASVVLLGIVALAALGTSNTPATVADAYYRGLWMLLPFTMQMTLILVLSSVVSATPLFRRAVISLADKPSSLAQVVALSVGLGAALSYFYWGLGVALGPLIAVHFSAAAERKGIPVDFPFLLAAVAASGAVWQFGLSSSAALLMATPGHFLEATVGVMSLHSTIWSLPAVLMSLTFPVGVVLLTLVLMPRTPRPLSAFREANALVATPDALVPPLHPDEEPAGFAAWVERSPAISMMLGLALLTWLYQHFVAKGRGLDLNAMNTILLTLAFLLHRNVAAFSKAIQGAVQVCWPILVLYHLYGGVAGLLQYTTVGERFAGVFASLSTPLTFPLLTAIGSSILAVFIPSSGGQWVVQGFVTAKTAAAVGTTAQRGLLAVGIGDHMGNFLSPFWVVVIAGIARVDFRTFFGYGVIFSVLWFTLGVGILTFVP